MNNLFEEYKMFTPILEEFIEISNLVYQSKLVCAYDGNLSVRQGELILITPSHISKKDLKKEDLVILDKNGQQIAGKHKASSEYRMHKAIYEGNPEIQAIIHAHPLYATAVFRKIKYVDTTILTEAKETFKKLPVLPVVEPGTDMLAEQLKSIDTTSIQACILENHGAVTWGNNLREVYYLMESLERLAKTHSILNQMK